MGVEPKLTHRFAYLPTLPGDLQQKADDDWLNTPANSTYGDTYQAYMLAGSAMVDCFHIAPDSEKPKFALKLGQVYSRAGICAQGDREYAAAEEQFQYAVDVYDFVVKSSASAQQIASGRKGLSQAQNHLRAASRAASHATPYPAYLNMTSPPGTIDTPTPKPGLWGKRATLGAERT